MNRRGEPNQPQGQPTDQAGRFFDAASEPVPSADAGARVPRPFLGIEFKCCRTYGRIYRNAEATRYQGACPRCGCQVKVPIGPGGQGSRFFSAG